ncbi:MAG: T9SS type A sorting domain-containing protein, partial [Bacteroidales bacterium]|nr:T9SS type A sorting domain-containing protein [Bacteroidales bacterium]
ETGEVPHRKIYAYFQSNSDFGTGEFGLGFFFADNPVETALEVSMKSENGFFAGAAANGVYYGLSYYFFDAAPPIPADLVAIEMKTGNKRIIGPWSDDQYMRIQDMTYSYADSTMYAVSYGFLREEDNQMASRIYTVDLETGAMERVAFVDTNAPVTLVGIAADYTGKMYAMDNNGVLYILNLSDGTITEICNTPYQVALHSWGMEVDHTDGSLYCTVLSQKSNPDTYRLIRFDLKASPVTYQDLGEIAYPTSSAAPYGLYIPFVLAGENAPTSATKISVTPEAQGALEATLNWTCPTTTFGYKPLTALKSVRILRDGQEIANLTDAEPGKAMTYTDKTVPERGYHEYTIIAVNEAGEGEKAYVNRYIGPDFPAKVTNAKVNKVDGCGELQLSWTASNGGENNSYVDPAKVSYRIVRYPDSVVVAENLKETAFNDKSITVLKAYSYGIFAVNEIGETVVVTERNVAGPALDAAVYFTCFDSQDTIDNHWTCIDNNQDNWSWQITTMYGFYQFGEGLPVVEYFVNPGLTPPGSIDDADDYFITPPFLLRANYNYKLSFDYRCLSDELLEITMGKSNTAESQNAVFELKLPPLDPYVEFGYQEVVLPPLEKDGIMTIGLHLTSLINDENYSYLQITNLTIQNTGPVSVEKDEVLEDIRISTHRGQLHIDGEFDKAEIYTLTGVKMLETGEATVSTASLTQGLYLVRVTRDNRIRTFKFVVTH